MIRDPFITTQRRRDVPSPFLRPSRGKDAHAKRKRERKKAVDLRYLKQFGLILGISFLGEILHHVLPLPVPASIYGIVLMFLALMSGVVRISDVEETSRFLLDIMPVLFLPAAVGLLDAWPVLRPVLLPVAVITVVTTVVVMVSAGLVTQGVIRRSGRGKEADHG